jgi:hypothetical protein
MFSVEQALRFRFPGLERLDRACPL